MAPAFRVIYPRPQSPNIRLGIMRTCHSMNSYTKYSHYHGQIGPQCLGLVPQSLLSSPLEQSTIFSWIGPLGLAGSHTVFGAFTTCIRSICTTHIYAPPHISSDLTLVDFWCALDALRKKISNNRVFAKSGIWMLHCLIFGVAWFDIVIFRSISFTLVTLHSPGGVWGVILYSHHLVLTLHSCYPAFALTTFGFHVSQTSKSGIFQMLPKCARGVL